MPIYEYQCKECDNSFEKLQKMSEAAVADCPKCAQVAERVVSAPSFQLKGTGWYATDFKDKKPAAKTTESTE